MRKSYFVSALHSLCVEYKHKNLRGYSIGCRKIEHKVITTANHNKGKYQKEPIRTEGKNKVTCLERGKTRMTKSRLVLVLNLIG